jgi:ferredoxin-like protein FixX
MSIVILDKRVIRAIQQVGLKVITTADIRHGELPVSELPVGVGSEFSFVTLVGGGGSSFWPSFERSAEYSDGRPDSMDRWSERVGHQLSNKLKLAVVFPFQGPPYFPFVSWASRTPDIIASTMGPSIHRDYGLWISYRLALFLRQDQVEQQSENAGILDFGCITCETQPCLNTCPVNAYTSDGFDRKSCFNYLDQNAESECGTGGCLARRACPIGKDYRYLPAQAQFHMNSFERSARQFYQEES